MSETNIEKINVKINTIDVKSPKSPKAVESAYNRSPGRTPRTPVKATKIGQEIALKAVNAEADKGT